MASLALPSGSSYSAAATQLSASSQAASAPSSILLPNAPKMTVTPPKVMVTPSRQPGPLRKSLGGVSVASSCTSPMVPGSPRMNPVARSTSGSMRRSGLLPTNVFAVDANAGVIASMRTASPSRPSGHGVVDSTRTASPLRSLVMPQRSAVTDLGGSLSVKAPYSPRVVSIEVTRPDTMAPKNEVAVPDTDLQSCKTTPEVETQLSDTMSLIKNTTKSELHKFVSVLKNELRHEIAEYVKVEIQQTVRQEMQRLDASDLAPREAKLQPCKVEQGSETADASPFVSTFAITELSGRIDKLKQHCEERLLTIENTFRGEFMPALATIVDNCGSMQKQVYSLEVEDIDRSNGPIAEEPEQTGDTTLASLLHQERMATAEVLASTRSDLLASMQDIVGSAQRQVDEKLQCVVELLPATQETAKLFIEKELHVLREEQTEEFSEHRRAVSQLDGKVNYFQKDLELALSQLVTHREILQSVCAVVKPPSSPAFSPPVPSYSPPVRLREKVMPPSL